MSTLDTIKKTGRPSKRIPANCNHCGAEFAALKSRMSYYCSRKCYLASRTLTDDKFWSTAERLDNGCWEWLGNIRNEYGRVTINGVGIYAHRHAYALKNGPVPDDLWVLHKCDNPICINPDHLFTGTPLDNTQDMFRKRRNSPPLRGGQQPVAKLTNAQAAEVRRRFIRESRLVSNAYDLAKEFGVNQWCIYRIVKMRTYVEAT